MDIFSLREHSLAHRYLNRRLSFEIGNDPSAHISPSGENQVIAIPHFKQVHLQGSDPVSTLSISGAVTPFFVGAASPISLRDDAVCGSLSSFDPHCLRCALDCKPFISGLEPYHHGRIHQSLVCRVQHRIERVSLGQLPFADWAGFGHYICHDLAPCLAGTIPFGYHTVVLAARECNKATC